MIENSESNRDQLGGMTLGTELFEKFFTDFSPANAIHASAHKTGSN
jgi:hypothetical protein